MRTLLITIIISLAFLTLAPLSSAYGMVIDIGFNIDKKDNVELTALDIGKGERQRFFDEETGPYQLSIMDSNGDVLDNHSFDVDFWVYSDPPAPLNYSSHRYRLKYYSTAAEIVIEHNGKEIFQRNLSAEGNCTENNICGNSENAFNCFRDCGPSSHDEYCTGLADRVCDPDCNMSEDIDCINTSQQTPFQCLAPAGMIFLLAVAAIRYSFERCK